MEANTTPPTAEAPTAEARLVAAYRAIHPKSRVTSILRLEKNTGSSKAYGCVLCGETGPSFSAKYSETKKSRTWCAEHTAGHVANVEAELVKLDAESAGRIVEVAS